MGKIPEKISSFFDRLQENWQGIIDNSLFPALLVVLVIFAYHLMVVSRYKEPARLNINDSFFNYKQKIIFPPEKNICVLADIDALSMQKMKSRIVNSPTIMAEIITKVSECEPRLIVLDVSFRKRKGGRSFWCHPTFAI